MRNCKKRNLHLCMQKVRQNDLKFSENQFFVFEMLIYFFVNVSSNFIIQERLDPLSNSRFKKEIDSFL